MKRFISYVRVSTQRQGESGLGIEAQQAAVRGYVNGHGELVAEYTEVETGKRADRPQLLKAIAHARRQKATLVIAKLDRLARNVAFTATLMESGADFVATDNPTATRLTIHILAAVAEEEARQISSRTIAALAAYKARGGLLGAARPECREISREAGRRGSPLGARRVAEQARSAYSDIVPTMQQLRNSGKSLREIAHHLNTNGHSTRTGQDWNPTQVRRVLERCRAED
jgi:DNA invertase Pin-like site-specific DNA recombinase